MAVLKNKALAVGSIFFLILLAYLLLADEKLKPETAEWMSVFQHNLKSEDNASLRLLSLGNVDAIFTNALNENYKKKLDAFKFNGLLGDEKPMKYPNVLQFEAFIESPLFCDLKLSDCVARVKREADYIKVVVKEFQPELIDFMSLNEVSSFKSLNPFVAELNLSDFMFLFKLKGTEIFFDIEEGRIEKAQQDLMSLILLNRQFFSLSDNLLTKISFSLNTENIYQPLLLKLKDKGLSSKTAYNEVLRPLSMQEISANNIQIFSFAKNARLIKAGLAVREKNSSGSLISRLWQKLVYKQNMTLNDMFVEYQALLLPDCVNKPSLLAFSQNIDEQIREKSEEQQEQPLLYRFKNMNNVVGASLKDVIMPRQINLYASIAKLDTRLQLLRVVLNGNARELGESLELERFANYYTGEKPFIDDGKLCSKLNNENICVAFQD